MSYGFPYPGGTRRERRMALIANVSIFGGIALLLIVMKSCPAPPNEGEKMKIEAERRAAEQAERN